MAHRRTGCRGGEHSEVTDSFTSLVFGDSRKPTEYGRVFARTTSKKFLRLYTDYERGVKQSNKEQTVERHIISMSNSLQKHIRACMSRTFFDGSDVEEEKLREALARHAQCWEEGEVDRSVAVAGVKKALATRSEVTTLDRVEAAWSSLEEYFALNSSIEHVFRDSRDRFKSSPSHIITAELVAGLNPPELKTKVATALDMKNCLKEYPGLVYSVTREAAEAWATVEQVENLRRVYSRPKGAVARVGSAKKGKRAVVGRGGQGSSAHSGDSKPRGSCWNYGKEGHRMADCTTKRKSSPPGGQQQATAQPGGATSGQQSSFQQSFKQGSGPPSYASGKGSQQGARSFTPTRLVSTSDGQQEGLDISATVVPPMSPVPSQGR